MKHLARIDVNIKNVYNGPVDIVEWTTADPFPHLGNEVGVDTETELITETNLAPPLVVLGVFDPQSATCYISYCEDAKVFINQLSKLEVRQYYFNLGFDEQVLDNEDPEKALMDAIEMGRVRDMQVRTQLHDIATKGFIPYNHYSLEDCSRLMLGIQLDKGEKDDPNSHRLTFRRGTKITQEQAIYLCWDCMSTFYLSTKIPEQPTEIQHTKGMCVLAHISQNGFPIDIRVYNAFKEKLQKAKDEYRAQLLTFGFPDPYAKDRDENGEYREFVVNKSEQFISLVENRSEFGQLNICKSNVRMALLYMYNFSDDKDHWQDVEESCAYWLTCEKPKTLRKAEKAIYDEMLIELDCLEAYFSAGKEIVMNALLGHVLEDLLNQQENKLERGYDFKHAVEYAAEVIDDNSHWLTNERQVGPVTFTQNHYKNLLKQYPKLELPMTAGGSYKLTLQDRWRLDDLDIKDPFLEVLTNYRHVEKFLSTYFNPEHLKPDVKVHPRFSNIKRTGRTSATAPPVQTLPSRESVYSLKNMFCPPKGAILCATDFSFVELCGFAQSCYDRFGISTMRDVINAGIDPHRWFAGVMNKIITADLTHKDDPEWVAKTNAYLAEHVTKKQRQDAKAANFGLPGAMGPARFYQHARSQGIVMTPEQAEEMVNTWKSAFKEMRFHMNPMKSKRADLPYDTYGLSRQNDDEDDMDDVEDPADKKKHQYMAVLKCGQMRDRCSYNSACNYQFQALVAVGAKVAGWNLVYNGYGDRLVNFVHDEYLYWLWPDEIQTHIPIIERLMLDGMRTVISDVKVGVESSCMLHWDKKAKEFSEIEFDSNGLPILEEPPFVKQLFEQQQQERA